MHTSNNAMNYTHKHRLILLSPYSQFLLLCLLLKRNQQLTSRIYFCRT